MLDSIELSNKWGAVYPELDDIFTILEGLANHPMTYDDKIVWQMIECVVVESKERIKVVFVGGMEIMQCLN